MTTVKAPDLAAVEARARARSQVPPLSRLAAYLLIALGAVLTVAPFYFMFVFATHTRTEIFQLPPPTGFGDHLDENYRNLLDRLPFWRNLWNSLYLAVLTTGTTLFFCTLAGYAFAMYRFKGREVLFGLVLATLLIPSTLNIVPFALIMQALGWIDQPRALWVPGMASAFGIFLMRQYIGSSIPRELVEAARIDGATEFGIFLRVILPLTGPALATLGLVTFVQSWNAFLGPLIIFRSAETYTAPLALRTLQSVANTDWGALMCGVALTVVPLLILFALASRQLIEGLTAGATKG
ncbi:carbohydrate ABC transporter membrane protein 2, CUT1 family (plasmid) [Deinococcus geothermalis DSM 11300]|uniref:Carbohydrate ABC transporter membrane protein 2, CUT1 family n=1 Tax=Deinococcus geothermalis (strain DSM 11300 / CIP 105573 / AG-3a) TaxID=319795 RepID=Q1J2J4_DEIGD|nr:MULTISPECIES: carbohydrate ABC transporter permease [Deinococcus]ABF44290.1 carbohydrate ABC transporter membrane protein 2, CUT1 family [Deinococcus geothermalis DSM 11300]MBI0446352.1 carbohydrate ABC transporter permease [Deinococcus sp. DB0503]